MVDVSYPGAHAPDRQWRIDASGIGLAAYEWGDPDAPPLLVIHGGFDFARTYDVFAPLLAAAGWRVVGWDQRGSSVPRRRGVNDGWGVLTAGGWDWGLTESLG